MSGGSHNYICYQIEEELCGQMEDEMYIPVTYFHRTPMYKVWEKLKAYKSKYVRDVKLLEGAQ